MYLESPPISFFGYKKPELPFPTWEAKPVGVDGFIFSSLEEEKAYYKDQINIERYDLLRPLCEDVITFLERTFKVSVTSGIDIYDRLNPRPYPYAGKTIAERQEEIKTKLSQVIELVPEDKDACPIRFLFYKNQTLKLNVGIATSLYFPDSFYSKNLGEAFCEQNSPVVVDDLLDHVFATVMGELSESFGETTFYSRFFDRNIEWRSQLKTSTPLVFPDQIPHYEKYIGKTKTYTEWKLRAAAL
ncbi:MAG: DUF6226 family protein [Micrococcaceae bacterium]